MKIKRMPAAVFVAELRAARDRRDGYIMGATGQDPRKWKETSWWFAQYSGKQRKKALHWREHAERVWDCNGLAEGIYRDFSGTNINTKARYNYSGWCGVRGAGMIPIEHRLPGAAVFWGERAGNIHHVAYLDRPVEPGHPEGDWYIIEARGVMYGVVETKLLSRKPNFWGIMDKYFDYGQESLNAEPELGERILENGMEGSDVKAMQENLIALGYDLGRYGADGDFGDCTELALMAFQDDHGCDPDGRYDEATHAATLAALAERKPAESPKHVRILGGQCWIRTLPSLDGDRIGVAVQDSVHPYLGETSEGGWLRIDRGWVSGRFGRLED